MAGTTAPPEGMLAQNIVHFSRVLRRAGLPVGPAKPVDALEAVRIVGLESRQDFYFALSAVMVGRHEHQAVFDEAFRWFWRDPARLGWQLQELEQLLSGLRQTQHGKPPPLQRVAQAMMPPRVTDRAEALPPDLSVDARFTVSSREMLRQKDFAGMSAQELQEARRMIASMRLPLPGLVSRRSRPRAHGGRVDMRATMQRMMREAGGSGALRFRAMQRRPPVLVILCDISGSMDSYTRMLLHFMHAVTNDRDRVHTFLFGTRLTNISRALRHRDVDVAVGEVSKQVRDWSGGTRIGLCLKEFNQRWARRLMGQGAAVLLISDGLDSGPGSDGADDLGTQMAALKLASRWLVWLNPLLRYDRFEAKPAGIRAMLPHVDLFLPVHNLKSLAELGEALSALGPGRGSGSGRPSLSPTSQG